jgi:hypothetical protein
MNYYSTAENPETRSLNNKLKLCADALGLDLWGGISLCVSKIVPTACWGFNQTRRAFEIHVNVEWCEKLNGSALQALLLHELYHHVWFQRIGCLGTKQGFASRSSRHLVNYALDIALEQVIARTPLGAALNNEHLTGLNDMMLLAPLSKQGPLSPDESFSLLVHANPPLGRMLPAHIEVWQEIWKQAPLPMLPEQILQRLSAVPESWINRETTRIPIRIELSEGLSGQGSEVFLPRQINGDAPTLELSDRSTARIAALLENAPGELASTLRAILVKSSPTKSRQKERLRQWLLQLTTRDRKSGSSEAERVGQSGTTKRLPYLVRPTRGELIRQSQNLPSFLYSNVHLSPFQPLKTYIDVSGSMVDHLNMVLEIVNSLQRYLPVELFLFDHEVRPHPKSKAIRGELLVGSSTSFEAVFQHALDRRFKDILVLTDGESQVSATLQSKVQRCGMRARAVLFSSVNKQTWWTSTFEYLKDAA